MTNDASQDSKDKVEPAEVTPEVAVTPEATQPVPVPEVRGEASKKSMGKILFALLMLTAAIYSVVCFSLGQSREVYLVNGLTVPYSVTVVDKTYELEPLSHKKIVMSGNTADYYINTENFKEFEGSVSFEDEFIKRPFDESVWVINPDKSAILRFVKMPHYKDPKNFKVSDRKTYDKLGNNAYQFDKVDDIFTKPPTDIKVEGQEPMYRHILGIMKFTHPMDIIQTAQNQLGDNREKYIDFLKTKRLERPDELMFLSAMRRLVTPEKFLALMRERLSVRPVNITWHRYYQNMIKSFYRDHDLLKEYQDYLAKEPGNNELKYLTARWTRDRNKAIELYKSSLEGDNPCQWSVLGLSMTLVANAEFEVAKKYVDDFKSNDRELMKGVMGYKNNVYMALKEYAYLIQQNEEALKTNPLNGLFVDNLVKLYCLNGEKDKAIKTIDAFITAARKKGNEQDRLSLMRHHMESVVAYNSGDIDAYITHREALKNPNDSPILLVCKKDYEGLDALLSNSKTVPQTWNLFAYIVMKSIGDEDRAMKYKVSLLNQLKSSMSDHQKMADFLSADTAPTIEELRNVPLPINEQCWFLTAIGLTHPSINEECFTWAQKLNQAGNFPYHFLEGIYSPKEENQDDSPESIDE